MATPTLDQRTANYEAMFLIAQGAAVQLHEILTFITQMI